MTSRSCLLPAADAEAASLERIRQELKQKMLARFRSRGLRCLPGRLELERRPALSGTGLRNSAWSFQAAPWTDPESRP